MLNRRTGAWLCLQPDAEDGGPLRFGMFYAGIFSNLGAQGTVPGLHHHPSLHQFGRRHRAAFTLTQGMPLIATQN